MHHDALELPGGRVVLLSALREGQLAMVLQLPAVQEQHKGAHAMPPMAVI
jgi:hypothetical protein